MIQTTLNQHVTENSPTERPTAGNNSRTLTMAFPTSLHRTAGEAVRFSVFGEGKTFPLTFSINRLSNQTSPTGINSDTKNVPTCKISMKQRKPLNSGATFCANRKNMNLAKIQEVTRSYTFLQFFMQ